MQPPASECDGPPIPLLYRYRSLAGNGAEWVHESIILGRHYFASPLSFNDPFDSQPNLSLEGSPESLASYYAGLPSAFAKRLEGLDQDERRRIVYENTRRYGGRSGSNPSLDPRDPQNEEALRQQYLSELRTQLGVLCLSEVCDDLLMWAHYADAHRGVCLVFNLNDSRRFPSREDTLPVRYSKYRPSISPHDAVSFENALAIALSVKSEHWAYEKEWRLFATKPGVCTFWQEKLTGVILGARISDENAALVGSWVQTLTPTPAIYFASITREQFSIQIGSIRAPESHRDIQREGQTSLIPWNIRKRRPDTRNE